MCRSSTRRTVRPVQKVYKAESFDFRLKPGSAAVDRGTVLPQCDRGLCGTGAGSRRARSRPAGAALRSALAAAVFPFDVALGPWALVLSPSFVLSRPSSLVVLRPLVLGHTQLSRPSGTRTTKSRAPRTTGDQARTKDPERRTKDSRTTRRVRHQRETGVSAWPPGRCRRSRGIPPGSTARAFRCLCLSRA